MGDFKQRLEAEQTELQDKLQKLIGFIGSDGFKKIDEVQKTLLNVQARAMETYNQVLLERIVRL
jgi:hypothetical protein